MAAVGAPQRGQGLAALEQEAEVLEGCTHRGTWLAFKAVFSGAMYSPTGDVYWLCARPLPVHAGRPSIRIRTSRDRQEVCFGGQGDADAADLPGGLRRSVVRRRSLPSLSSKNIVHATRRIGGKANDAKA